MNQDIFVVVEHLRGALAEISYVMMAAGRDLARTTGGKVYAVLLGQNVQNLADTLAADAVLYLESPSLADFTSDGYCKALSGLIGQHQPRAVLMGHTSVGTDVAGALSVRLGLPLVTSVRHFEGDKFVSQICGGKIMAEGELPAPTALITLVPGGYKPESGQSAQAPLVTPVAVGALEDLRVSVRQYIEPEAGDRKSVV